MVANYPNASVFYPSNPVGVDSAILNIQQKLAQRLLWLEKVFGRCTLQQATTPDKKRIIFPEVYQESDEPMSAMPNDNFKSYCFFNVSDPGEFENYDFSDPQSNIKRPLSIIFWFNLDKINDLQTGRFNENLIIETLKALKECPEFTPESTFEEYNNIFDKFTITDEYRNFIKLPFSGFRIAGELRYPAFGENIC